MTTKRICTVLDGLEIVRADQKAWRRLAGYHYRGQALGPITKVFAARYKINPNRQANPANEVESIRRKLDRDGDVVGVIVYGPPMPNSALRNLATGGRYEGTGGLELLNREMTCIRRVVVHPSFRGLGLGVSLVKETLGYAGTELVEAMAVMGRANPFFQRAGMKRYEGPLRAESVRLLAAIEKAGIQKEQLLDGGVLLEAVNQLNPKEMAFVKHELERFCRGYSGWWKREQKMNRETLSKKKLLGIYTSFVCEHVLSRPVYFLWQR